MNEGDTSIENFLLQVGARLHVIPAVRAYLIYEDNVTAWEYSGSMVGFEYVHSDLSGAIMWYQAEGNYQQRTFQVTMNTTSERFGAFLLLMGVEM